MIVLIKIMLAHFIGDFLIQPPSWVKEKEQRKVKSPKLYLHVLIHGALMLTFLWSFEYWLLIISLMVSHAVIDTLKLYAQKESNKSTWFLIDQGLHVISIIGMWMLFLKPELNLTALLENTGMWIYLTALFFITIVSGIAMRELMASWSKALAESNDESLINAGRYIGILERLFVFTFVVTNNWEGIGFLLAANSVFRFGDLKESKDRKLTEYILIGTLLSFGLAMATGIMIVKLTQS